MSPIRYLSATLILGVRQTLWFCNIVKDDLIEIVLMSTMTNNRKNHEDTHINKSDVSMELHSPCFL